MKMTGTIVAGSTGILAVGACVGSAAASTTPVVSAIKAQDKVIRANPEYKQLKNFKITTAKQAKATIPKLHTLARTIDTAATKVSQSSATTAQTAGKTDWVNAARDEAKGIDQIATALNEAVSGKKAAAKTTLTRAIKTVDSGDALAAKADKALGLPAAD